MTENPADNDRRFILNLMDLLSSLDDFDQASEAAMSLWASRFLEHLSDRLDLAGCALLVSKPDGFGTLARHAMSENSSDAAGGAIRDWQSRAVAASTPKTSAEDSCIRGVELTPADIGGSPYLLAKVDMTGDEVLWAVFATREKAGPGLTTALSIVTLHVARVITGTMFIKRTRETSEKLTKANQELKEMQVCSLNIMEDLRRRNRDLRMLNTGAQDMAQRTTLPEIAEAAAEAAARMLDGAVVGVFVSDEQDQTMRLTHLTGEHGIDEPTSHAIAGNTAIYRRLLGFEEVRFDSIDDATQPGVAVAIGSKTGLIIPLHSKKQLLGCLMVCECRWHRVFTDDEFENLRMLANTLAVAIENSRLLSRTAKQVQEISILKEYIETVVDSVDLAILVVNNDLKITMFNKGFERIYGYKQHDYIGKRLFEAFPRLLEQGFAEVVQQVLNGKPFERFGWRRQMSDGRDVVQNLRVSPHRDASGHIVGAIAIIGDVTEKANLEDRLARSEAKFSRLVEDLEDAYFIVTEGKIAYGNKAAAKLTGLTTCKLPGMQLDSIISDKEIVARGSQPTGGKVKSESRINHTSGTWIPVEVTLSPCEYGGVQAVSLVVTDITERKKIEKQLDEKNRAMHVRNEQITRLNLELEATLNRLKASQQNLIKSERIAAITETAVAANHEINNPLFSILGHAQLLIRKFQGSDPDTAERLRVIEESALRIACVTKKLANLADPVVKEYSGLATSMIDIDRSRTKPSIQIPGGLPSEQAQVDVIEHHPEDQ